MFDSPGLKHERLEHGVLYHTVVRVPQLVQSRGPRSWKDLEDLEDPEEPWSKKELL